MNQHLLLLFSFDLLSISFVSQYDTLQHILLDQPAPGTFKVVKNAQSLQLLFSRFEKLGLVPVCFSHKKYKLLAPVLNKINQNLRWYYINVDKDICPHLQANQACLRKLQDGTNLIQYGEGFSACQGKEELRMAVCSAFRMGLEESVKRIIIYENNTQQLTKLKQNGYQYVFSQIPIAEKLPQHFQQLQKIFLESKNGNYINDKQLQQFLKDTPTLQDPKYVRRIAKFHYFEKKKNIVLSSGLGFSNVPSYRLPKSMSVCSVIFRYLGDKQIYIGKSDITSKLGGDIYYQSQEDKVLASCLYQTLRNFKVSNQQNKSYICLPMYVSHFTIKHSLVKSYNKNKGCFVVRPYVRNLKTIAELLTAGKQYEQLLQLFKHAKFQDKVVKGFGSIVALSLVINQQFSYKGLVQSISFYSEKQSFNTISNIKQEQKEQDCWNCCKIDFLSCFKPIAKIKQNILETEVKLIHSPEISISLSQLHPSYIKEMKQIFSQLQSNLPMFQSLFSNQAWNSNKDNQLSVFKQLLIGYYKGFELGKTNNPTKIQQISDINPRFLNFLVASSKQQSFDHFTNVTKDQSYQMYGFGLDKRNLYQQMMSATQNFIIFGQSVPIISLIRWIKSIKNNVQIMYITLLHDKKQLYEKQLKLAKSEKKNILFIIDHCQIQEAGGDLQEGKSITDLNWGLRTIFIYRIKLGSSKKLKVLHDSLTSGGVSANNLKLTQSKQEIFSTINHFLLPNNQKQGLFNYYDKSISLWIANKWMTLGLKMGIQDLNTIKSKLKIITKSISLKGNRLIALLKDKQLNNFKIVYREGQQFNYDTSDSTLLQNLIVKKNHNINTINQIREELDERTLQHLKNVPQAQLILYCLPIFIANQRVWLHHDIYQYLSAFYLYENIAKGCWTGNLEGEQFRNFQKWYYFMNKNQKQQIKINLMKLVQKFAKEKSHQSQLQIMGRNSNLSDCLELMKKIGIYQIFCKLQEMFYLDSAVTQICSLFDEKQKNIFAVTKKGSIFKIAQQNKKQKHIQKALVIYQKIDQGKMNDEKINFEKINIGAFQNHTENEKWMIFTFVNLEINKKIIQIKQKSLRLKQIWIKQSQAVEHYLQVKLGKFSEYLQKCKATILKVFRIKYFILIFVLNNGSIIITNMNKIIPNLIEKEQLTQLTFYQQINNSPWRTPKLREQVSQEQKLQDKQKLQFDQNGLMSVTHLQEQSSEQIKQQIIVSIGAICKRSIINNITDQKYFPIGVTQFRVTLKSKGQIGIQEIINMQLRTSNEAKSLNLKFNLNFQNKIKLDILALQSKTGILNLWIFDRGIPADNSTHLDPFSRFYQIQAEPTTIFKDRDTLYVASKHAFMKKMLLPSSQAGKEQIK